MRIREGSQLHVAHATSEDRGWPRDGGNRPMGGLDFREKQDFSILSLWLTAYWTCMA